MLLWMTSWTCGIYMWVLGGEVNLGTDSRSSNWENRPFCFILFLSYKLCVYFNNKVTALIYDETGHSHCKSKKCRNDEIIFYNEHRKQHPTWVQRDIFNENNRKFLKKCLWGRSFIEEIVFFRFRNPCFLYLFHIKKLFLFKAKALWYVCRLFCNNKLGLCIATFEMKIDISLTWNS